MSKSPKSNNLYTIKNHKFGNYIFINTSDISKNIDKIKDNPNVIGIQKTYYWKDLEKSKDVYDFSRIRKDLDLLKKYNKQLVLQFQIKSFNNNLVLIPNYLLNSIYGGGIYKVINHNNGQNGTNAVIWNENLKSRYIKVLNELAKEFDNDLNFEAITLNETAISTDRSKLGYGYTNELYYKGITDIMLGARNAFRKSSVIQYINFLPNNNDISRIYDFADKNDIGIGGPDIYVTPGPLLEKVYSEVSKQKDSSIIGYAIQWNDYTQKNRNTGNNVSVMEIYNYAQTKLKPDYYFWLNREPYFSNEVLPIINR